VMSLRAAWIADPSSTKVTRQPRLSRVLTRQLSLTDLVELDGVIFCTHLGQESLGGAAVWAVGLAKHGYFTISIYISMIKV
jgi:hypothetical protein